MPCAARHEINFPSKRIQRMTRYLFILLALFSTSSLFAQTPDLSPTWRFETFGDYYYKLNGDSVSQELQFRECQGTIVRS